MEQDDEDLEFDYRDIPDLWNGVGVYLNGTNEAITHNGTEILSSTVCIRWITGKSSRL